MGTGHRGNNRDYKQEYGAYHGKPEQRHERSERVTARREVEKKVGNLPKSKEVDHIKALAKGGSNAPSNLRVISKEANRKKGDRSK